MNRFLKNQMPMVTKVSVPSGEDFMQTNLLLKEDRFTKSVNPLEKASCTTMITGGARLVFI